VGIRAAAGFFQRDNIPPSAFSSITMVSTQELAMTIAEILVEPFDLEVPMTRRILEAIPGDDPAYKPHEKSMALGRLAMHIATLPALGILILTTPELDAATARFPDATFVSRNHLLSEFDTRAAELRAILAGSSDAELQQPWKFGVGDFVFSNSTRSCTFQHMFLGHLIHHRAQLGVYLRLLNLPVPGVYGPSADDKLGR
jgi:uncharacterized damage-inducible protein DinB